MTDIVNDPHPFDEDPEEHIGDELPDPWSDPEQTDWPNDAAGQNDSAPEETEVEGQ